MENYYQLLGLSTDATSEEIKQRCLALGQACRPDKYKDEIGAQERFEKIEKAFATLTNPESRAAYDASLSKGADPLLEMGDLVAENPERRIPRGKLIGISIVLIALIGVFNHLEAARVERKIAKEKQEREMEEQRAIWAKQDAERYRYGTPSAKCDRKYIKNSAAVGGRYLSESDIDSICRGNAMVVENDRRNSAR